MNKLRDLALFWVFTIERLNKKYLDNGWGLFQGLTTLGVIIGWLQIDASLLFANIFDKTWILINHEVKSIAGMTIIMVFIVNGLIYNRKRYKQACARFESLDKNEKRKYVVALWLCIFAFIGLTVTAFATIKPHPYLPNTSVSDSQ